MKATQSTITVKHLPSCNPDPPLHGKAPAHHAGGAHRTHFQNPWPSARSNSFVEMFNTRFLRQKNFVPVPEDRKGLVRIRQPDWGRKADPEGRMLKATWIGHATWLIETAIASNGREDTGVATPAADASQPTRGVRILFDPVFSERTSPVKWIGPKRYTPVPCTVAELPEIDIVAISHNHYDHLDIDTIKQLLIKQRNIHFLCGLGNKEWFLSLGTGIVAEQVTELDWWEGLSVDVAGVGRVRMTCTPTQHFSSRTLVDKDKTLWCSWVLQEGENKQNLRKLFFAGDTGYRQVSSPDPSAEEEAAAPHCPAFSQIGNVFGPFDLALLPIGLYSPRDFMSSVHCAPEDSICVHQDLKSTRSIGMHYGTVRGGISAYYEEVTEPPRRFKQACEKAGLKWGQDVDVCDIGETIVVA